MRLATAVLLAMVISLPGAFADVTPPVVTNINQIYAAISWTSSSAATGWIVLNPGAAEERIVYDTRGELYVGKTHYVDVVGLTEETTYLYDVVTAGLVDDNSGAHYSFSTGPDIGIPSPGSVYGQTLMCDEVSPAEGAIVFVTLQDCDGAGSPGLSTTMSALVDETGWWWYSIDSARTPDLSGYFTYSAAGDCLVLHADGGPSVGTADLVVDTADDTPAPSLILCDVSSVITVPGDYATIQAAIDAATNGDEIVVSPGTHYENVNFNGKNIILRSTDPTDPVVVGGTIIDGNEASSVVSFSGAESSGCVLSGFTITNGYASNGGGIWGNGTMATIQHNTVTENSAGANGGGISGCDGTIQNNIITANSAHTGAGLFGCDGTIRNNTIWENPAGSEGGGLSECYGTIVNCIIWANTASADAQLHNCVTPTYSCIQDWAGDGEGSLTSNPLLVFPSAGDFHLQFDSPCIDAGCYASDFTEDFEGDPRGYDITPEIRGDGSDFDIGADEYRPVLSPPAVDVTPDPAEDSPRTTHHLLCAVTSQSTDIPGLVDYEYSWSNGTETIVHGPKADSTDILDASYTAKHETWTCTVRGWDGYGFSEAAMDATTVVNSPPGAPALSLPTYQSTDADLPCQVVVPSSDADADPITYSFEWWVKPEGEQEFSLFGDSAIDQETFSVVPQNFTSVGDAWYCLVTPNDREVDGIQTQSDECTIISNPSEPSAISLIVDPMTVPLGWPVTVYGEIDPIPVSGTIVSFDSISPSGVPNHDFPEAMAIGGNTYSRTFYPTEASEGRPDWSVTASWPGDSLYMGATSDPVSFTVTKGQPTLLLELSASSIPVGLGGIDELTATATLIAPIPDELGPLLDGNTIELYWRDPDGQTPLLPLTAETVLESTTTGTRVGLATFDLLGFGIDFSKAGTWTFLANFNEDENFTRATSPGYPAVRLVVKDGAGYAIIALGRLDSYAEGHQEHAKTTDYVYGVLRDRGFAHEDIYYLRDVLDGETVGLDIVVDGAATQDNVQYAIEQWALARMGERAAPLYVIFIDHGRRDCFYLYSTEDEDDYVTPDDVTGYFETLHTGLEQTSQEAADQDIVFIYGACRSGSFVPPLSGEQYIVIASCAADEASHRGVIDPADGIRDGEVFVTELFRNASAGKTLRHSFELASEKVAEYTAGRSNSGRTDHPQHPLLDDPGNRAEQLVLGFGSNAARSVGWQYATAMVIGPDEPIGVLEARADRDYLTEDYEAWVEIKTPAYDGAELADDNYEDFQQVVTMPRISYSREISDLDTGTFRWSASVLTSQIGFVLPGTYKVFYYIADPETGETNTYLLTTIYRGREANEAPLPVTLLYPEDGATVGRTPVFLWEETTDPDGDAFTYRLEVAEDSEFTTGLIVKEGLTWTAAVIGMTDELKDRQTYYWRVIPVDEYGAAPADNTVLTFTTDFQNGDVPGAIVGFVTDARTGAPIAGATITVSPGPGTGTSSKEGNYVVAILPKGEHAVQAEALGYENEIKNADVPPGGLDEVSFQLVPLVTDSDGDGIPDADEGTNDPDDDGIPNYLDTDSDGDGTPDADEGTGDPDQDGVPNYLDTDSDDDGLSDADEVNVYGTSPTSQHSDTDTMPDGYEVQYGLDPTTDDSEDDLDGDGLPNGDEYELGCEPDELDSDEDALTDGDEVNEYGTDPTKRDTDGDGASDGYEVQSGTDPVDQDDFPCPKAGDVNCDDEVNAIDVQLVINAALGLLVEHDCDLNGDDYTNALDVQLVINAALGIAV